MAPSKLLLLAAISALSASVHAQAPLSNPPLGFVYVGCYTDGGASDRTLANQGPGDQVGTYDTMTIENCINGCNEGLYSYNFVGLEYYGEVCPVRPVLHDLLTDFYSATATVQSGVLVRKLLIRSATQDAKETARRPAEAPTTSASTKDNRLQPKSRNRRPALPPQPVEHLFQVRAPLPMLQSLQVDHLRRPLGPWRTICRHRPSLLIMHPSLQLRL